MCVHDNVHVSSKLYTQLTPFHNILADIVETSGGSRELLRILNRLGCTPSPDTHECFVTYHAEA